MYQLIDLEIVKHLVQTKNKNSVKIFVYLADKYQWKRRIGEDGYNFTIKELLEAIGYSSKSRNAPIEELVKHILQDLRMSHHIDYIEYYDTIISENNNTTPTPKKRLTYVAEHSPYTK